MSAAINSETDVVSILTKGSWILLTILTLGGFLFGSVKFAAGVATGGVLAILNFYWMGNILKRVLANQYGHGNRYVQIRYILRLTLLGIALLGLIRLGVDISGLLIGLSVLVINIIVLSIYHMMTLKGG